VPSPGDYRIDNWTTDQGLPQNTVQCLLQTHDGYLWLGTQSGLARFDGLHFTVFDHKPVGPKYERIIDGGPSFHEDGSLEFLGIRKDVLYRVVGKPMSPDAGPRTSKP
jgi:hypothetical protein